jgi:sugar lactone lactonase YvrE
MNTRGARSYFGSIVRSVCLHLRPYSGLRPYVQLGVLLLVLWVSGQATVAAQVQLAPEITTYAGNGTSSFNLNGNNGPATSAELDQAAGVAVDSAGNLYIADENVVWKVTAATGTITVVAGNGTQGFSGQNGPATSAALGAPTGVAVDSAGNLYIADSFDFVIWKVTAATGTITVIAGNGTSGFSGNNGPATSAELSNPEGVAVDRAGNLYIADSFGADVIWKVTAATGTITVVAGNGTSGFSGQNGPATSAELGRPAGVAVDRAGNLFIADAGNNVVWKVTAATGTITEVAGNGTAGFSGDGSPATSAELNFPNSVAVDSAGNLYIADEFNNVIRKVSAATGTIATVAGTAGIFNFSGNDGPAISAELGLPSGVAVDSAGDFYIADFGDDVVWKVFATILPFPTTAVGSASAVQNVFLQLNAAQTITSITATPSQAAKQEYLAGTVTGCAVDGATSNPAGTICTVPVTFQPAYTGNRGVSLLAVTNTGTFAFGLSGIGTGPQVALIPGTIVTAAGNGTPGDSGDGGAPASAELSSLTGIAVDSAGNSYIADTGNNVVRKISAANGTITTVAGNGTAGFSGDGGAATSAELNLPQGVAVDSAGNLYIADGNNERIRFVSAATGTITTIAGNGTGVFSGDNGPATTAGLSDPMGLVVDSAGNLYIADTGNQRVRFVSATTGTITTIAGNGTQGFSGDGGAATSAELNTPKGVALDSAGNLYIAHASAVRKVTATTGTITTVAGNGTSSFSGDGGAATSATLNNPAGVAVDSAGNLYIADTLNQRIRFVSAGTGTIITIAGNGTQGSSGNNGAATSATLNDPQDIALDSVGNLYISDSRNFVLREVEVTLPPAVTFATPTLVGTADTADGPQTISVSNIGNATLTFPTAPSAATGFTVDSSSTCPSGSSATLSSGANCTVAVDFVPTVAGNISGALVVTDNTLNAVGPNFATQSIALSGVSTAAAGPAFTLTGPSGTTTVAAGAVASFSLTLTPATGTTLNDPITLTATGLPPGATASFSPAPPITLGSAAATVTLNIQTASAQTARNEQPIPGNPFAPVALGFLLLPLLGTKAAGRRLRQSLPLLLLFAGLSLGMVLGMSGCSSGSRAAAPPPPPPAAQTFTVVVTATDATTNVQSTANLTLTVQ